MMTKNLNVPLIETADDGKNIDFHKLSSIDIQSGEDEIKPKSHQLHGRALYMNLLLLYLVNLICEAARGVVVPIMSSYIEGVLNGNDVLSGFTFSIFVVGRLISALLLSIWADRKPQFDILLFSMIIAASGNIIYGLSILNPDDYGKWILFIGRFVEGFATGVIACSRSHIAYIAEEKHRTRYLAWSVAAQYVGFSLSPCLGIVFANVNFHIKGLLINGYTAPLWFMAIVDILLFISILFVVDRISPEKTQVQKKK